MYTADKVDQLIEEWKKEGFSKPELVVKIANACLGWSYVWGSLGQYCTVANRKKYMGSSSIASGDINLIKKRCPILSGLQSKCEGCIYYPENKYTRIFDCRGFTRWVLGKVGIALAGGGATTQWNTASNWTEKGTIDTLPKDKVCCIFRKVGNKMEHTLFYDGDGHYIHCSGEVKKQAISTYKATHWAIPKGLYTNVVPTPTPEPAIPEGKAKVTGKNVALRQGPSTSASIITRIATNQLVNVLTSNNSAWSYVKYCGKNGYMMNEFLSIDAAAKTAKVIGKKVALRAGPSTAANVLLRINTGELVNLIDPPSDWLHVSYNNREGYMMREFLKEG